MTMDNFIFKHHCQVKVSLISHRYHTGTTPIQHRYYIGILVETETDTSWRYDTTSIYMTDDNVGKLLTHLLRNSGSFLTKTSFFLVRNFISLIELDNKIIFRILDLDRSNNWRSKCW